MVVGILSQVYECIIIIIIIIIKNEKIRVTLCENTAGALYIGKSLDACYRIFFCCFVIEMHNFVLL